MSESKLQLPIPSRVKASKTSKKAIYTWRSTYWFESFKYFVLSIVSMGIALKMAPYPHEGYWLHEYFYVQGLLVGYSFYAVIRAMGALISTCKLTMSPRFLSFSRTPFSGINETLRMESILKLYCDERPHAGITVHTIVVILKTGHAIELYYDKDSAFIRSLFDELEMTKKRLANQ